MQICINDSMYKPSRHIKRILGGVEVPDKQFTYQVSLQYEGQHTCGGGIISEQHIITAGHCVIDKKTGVFISTRMTVVIGVINIVKSSTSALKILVERMYVPREYKPSDMDPDDIDHVPNDIAILRLIEPFNLDDHPHLTLLKLPEKPYSDYTKTKATIAGFGYNRMKVVENPETFEYIEKGSSDGKMRYAVAKTLTNDECKYAMNVPIHESDICARVEQNDDDEIRGVCSGDSGGPLVHQGNIVIGILSLNPSGCREEHGAGIYTRVTSHIEFIKNSLHNLRSPDIRMARWYMQDNCGMEKAILVEKKSKRKNTR